MTDVAITPIVVNLGVPYTPPVVRVLLQPTTPQITEANYQADYLDNVELSTPAQVYLSGLTGPGPDLSEALTQIDAGPVTTFIAGDYAGAVLVGQNLQGAIFDGTNMQDVNFSGANLQDAQFINTYVAGAQFDQTDLRGADLSGAMGLQPNQVYRANYDASTTFPDSIDASIYGPFGA